MWVAGLEGAVGGQARHFLLPQVTLQLRRSVRSPCRTACCAVGEPQFCVWGEGGWLSRLPEQQIWKDTGFVLRTSRSKECTHLSLLSLGAHWWSLLAWTAMVGHPLHPPLAAAPLAPQGEWAGQGERWADFEPVSDFFPSWNHHTEAEPCQDLPPSECPHGLRLGVQDHLWTCLLQPGYLGW